MGMLQLVFAGALALLYAITALVEQPTLVFSCGVNEVTMSFSQFLIIFTAAATGLQGSKGGADPNDTFKEAENEYAIREILLLVVQLNGMGIPAVVCIVQLLLLRPLTTRLVPKMLRPWDDESGMRRSNLLQSTLEDREQLNQVIKQFDSCDFKRFNLILSTSSATVGLISLERKQLHPSAHLRAVLTRSLPAKDAAKAAG